MPKEQLAKKEADIIPLHKEGTEAENNRQLSELNKQISDNEEEIQILKDAIKEGISGSRVYSEHEERESQEMQAALNLLEDEQRSLLSRRDSLEEEILSPDELREIHKARESLGKAETPAAYFDKFTEALKKQAKNKG